MVPRVSYQSVRWRPVVVLRVSYQTTEDQKWSPECLTSHVEISSGPQNVLPVEVP